MGTPVLLCQRRHLHQQLQQIMSAIARLAVSPRLSMAAARSLRPASVQATQWLSTSAPKSDIDSAAKFIGAGAAVIVATIKNTTRVETPVTGSHRGSKGPLVSKVVHNSQSIIVGECFKPHGDQSDICCGSIKITNLVIIACRVPAGVGVLLLSHYAKH